MSEMKIQRSLSLSLQQDAADQKAGLTLDELAAFVAEALRQNVDGGTVVKQTATWRSSIKRLEIKG